MFAAAWPEPPKRKVRAGFAMKRFASVGALALDMQHGSKQRQRSASECKLPNVPRAFPGSALQKFGSQNSTSSTHLKHPASGLPRIQACCDTEDSDSFRSPLLGAKPSPSQECLIQGSPATFQSRSPCKMQQVREEWVAREAQRKSDEEAAKRLRAEQMQHNKEIINSHLQTAGETAQYVKVVLDLIHQADSFPKVCPEGKIEQRALDPFCLKAKHKLFEQIWLTDFPFNMSQGQKKCIVDRILAEHTSSELLHSTSVQVYLDGVFAAIRERSTEFICPICMDPMVALTNNDSVDTSGMWFAPLRKTEHWSNYPCGHACCRSCMAQWAETEINDQKIRVKCPAEHCSYSLWDQDLRELVNEQVFERHTEHKNADHLKALRSAMKSSFALKSWLRTHARPCPDCHVIVSRSEGCNHMTCVCGARFCYACGFKRCKCNSTSRRDIWNPQT